MTNEKAIKLLMRMQEPEPYEPQITEDAFMALQLAIDVLKDRENGNVIVLGRDYWSRYYDITEKEWFADGEYVDKSFCIMRKEGDRNGTNTSV